MAGSGPQRPLNLALSSLLFAQPATAPAIRTIPTTPRSLTDIACPLNSTLRIVAALLEVVQGNSTSRALNRATCLFHATLVRRVASCPTLNLGHGSATPALLRHNIFGRHQRKCPLRVTERAIIYV